MTPLEVTRHLIIGCKYENLSYTHPIGYNALSGLGIRLSFQHGAIRPVLKYLALSGLPLFGEAKVLKGRKKKRRVKPFVKRYGITIKP